MNTWRDVVRSREATRSKFSDDMISALQVTVLWCFENGPPLFLFTFEHFPSYPRKPEILARRGGMRSNEAGWQVVNAARSERTA